MRAGHSAEQARLERKAVKLRKLVGVHNLRSEEPAVADDTLP